MRHWSSVLSWYCGEQQTTQEQVTAMMREAGALGARQFVIQGEIIQGRLWVEQELIQPGVMYLQQAIAAYAAIGAAAARSLWLAWLGEAFKKAEQLEEGLPILIEALEWLAKSGERAWEAELYRLKGELLLAQENQKSNGKSQK